MCGPCSDGTYWDDKPENAYFNPPKPAKERCTLCNEPINWCHCELSLDRLERRKNTIDK